MEMNWRYNGMSKIRGGNPSNAKKHMKGSGLICFRIRITLAG
jgi:hypothetical protein